MTDRTTMQRQADHVRLEEIKQRLGVLASHPGAHSQAAQAEGRGLRYELLGLEAGR